MSFESVRKRLAAGESVDLIDHDPTDLQLMANVVEAAKGVVYQEGQNWLEANEYMERLRSLRAALDAFEAAE